MEKDAAFIKRLVSCAKLPSVEVGAAQFDWVLTTIRENCPSVQPAPYIPNGHRTLRETADALRKALQTLERTRSLLIKWSEGESDESKFYRNAIDAALLGSLLVPDEFVSTQFSTHRAYRVERLLPRVPDGLADELKKISAYAQKSPAYTRYDPNERVLVQLLWLVFETSGRKVTLASRGSHTLSPFQRVCVELFERAGLLARPKLRGKPSSSINLPNRIRDHIAAGRKNKRLYRIKDIMADQRLTVENVPTVMMAWFDWLMGFDIPEAEIPRGMRITRGNAK